MRSDFINLGYRAIEETRQQMNAHRRRSGRHKKRKSLASRANHKEPHTASYPPPTPLTPLHTMNGYAHYSSNEDPHNPNSFPTDNATQDQAQAKKSGWFGSLFSCELPYAFPRSYPEDTSDEEETMVRPPPVVPHRSGPSCSHPILDQEIEGMIYNTSRGIN